MAVPMKFLVPKLIVAVDKNYDLNIQIVLGTGKNRTKMDVSYNMQHKKLSMSSLSLNDDTRRTQGGRVRGNQLGKCHHTTWPEKRMNERG